MRGWQMPDPPPVGTGWFSDNFPGVLWFHDGNTESPWCGWLDGQWVDKTWAELLPGRPAVPAGE